MSDTSSEWSLSTDIYSIRETVDEIKAKYVSDEDETTLALGIFGFLGDIEAKKIQTAAIMAGELGNEMFPSRAKLDKNILAHAIYCNIGQINAIPAEMTVRIGIKETDLDKYMVDDEFIFDRDCPIYIGDTEFHIDYDIILKRRQARSNPYYTTESAGTDVSTTTIVAGIPVDGDIDYKPRYIYNAQYDMDDENRISDIKSPYLSQPVVMNFNNYRYVFMSAQLRQVSINEITDIVVTNSIIDNKSYSFNFSDQLADFEVYCVDGDTTTYLTPLFYGSPIESNVGKYCWYLYMNDSTVRISFDSNSYIPYINTEIHVRVKTTKGAAGNFTYKDRSEYDIYTDFKSTYTDNRIITCLIQAATDAERGTDRKSASELKSLIPKMALSRGYITTETDLNNYFNLISDRTNVVKLQKKVDNQLQRIWYSYFLIKDAYNNLVPTNTLRIKFDPEADFVVHATEIDGQTTNIGRLIIPAGTNFVYDPNVGYATYIKPEDVPEYYSDAYFDKENELYYYKTLYNIVLNIDPQYAAYYLTVINQDSHFIYNYANEDAYFGFTTIRNHFERNLLSDHYTYKFTFNMVQSIDEDYGLFTVDDYGNVVKEANRVKCILVLCRNHAAYRYKECEIQSYDPGTFVSEWKCEFNTDDGFDMDNRIKITDMFEVGYNSMNHGYLDNNCEAYLYIAAKMDEYYPDPNLLLNSLEPGLVEQGYSLIDVYQIADGLSLFSNFTKVMNTRVVLNMSTDGTKSMYDIYGLPLIGCHYFTNESNITYFVQQLMDRKAYIDYCMNLIENNMDIDFKFFNTYGHSWTYHIGDKEKTPLGRLDISMRFRVKLANNNDLSTKDSIVEYIKDYIEDLDEQGDFHIPNLIHAIKENYNESIEYIEFMNFNDFRLGVQHIELRNIDDPHIVPEFINVRNKLSEDGTTLVPCIEIEVVFDDED